MGPHPYRRPALEVDRATGDDRAATFEERCVAVVLLVAGAVGLAIGLGGPREHGTEFVLGVVLIWLAKQALPTYPQR